MRNILAVAPELDQPTAERIVGQLHERERPVCARVVADYLGLRKTDWVYANAERVGGCALGRTKAAVAFYLFEVAERRQEIGASPPSQSRSPNRDRAAGRGRAR